MNEKKPPTLATIEKIPEQTEEQTIISPIQNVAAAEAQAALPALLVISGPTIGRSFAIEKPDYLIGRVESCDLVIDDELVSRHHCKILTMEGNARVQDLNSTNGTFVNGRRVSECELKEGDQIQVGSTTILKFHFQEEVETRFLSELYQAATKDFLTNVYNKKYLLDRLQSEFSYAHRHGGDLSVLVLDIDHFKKINDTYGHLAGDLALQKLAHFLGTHTRRDDVVARFGGEEFVILMRDCDRTQAQSLAENLRKGISELSISTSNATFHITVSIGVSTLSESNKAQFHRFETLLEEADSKLYDAKNGGRNRVCI